MLTGEAGSWRDEVYYEQEETRGVRTLRYAYWKRIEGIGPAVLFDMLADPGQHENLIDDPAYDDVIAMLDEKLDEFFARYSARKYDLWNGGTAKGSVVRPHMFRKLYGEEWRTISEMLPIFVE